MSTPSVIVYGTQREFANAPPRGNEIVRFYGCQRAMTRRASPNPIPWPLTDVVVWYKGATPPNTPLQCVHITEAVEAIGC